MARSTRSDQVEVYGRSVQALLNAMEFFEFKAHRVLAAHGIEPLEPEKWYPLPSVLDSFEDILKQVGPHTTRAIGHAVPENAVFPPGIHSFTSALAGLDAAYRLNHRGTGDIGGYHYHPETERTARMVCDNPYPCEFDLGLLEALYKRFKPKGSILLRIEHDGSGCRSTGAEACTYQLKW
ncbi:hypothetical protein [Vitiosangium sp. GDMCC 1.1324]|uniref:hypothetical protein n=1 Tax=Vitiosangium sp. (strain GDMCC 1.1324) TaxID=2138576 RepID=UPI000D358B6F|nr:hypothetical protein [Vitiosangium sp. GDMCC 1.1324]PTL75993.1 hypothetical protein DAT35_51620 [Vitiosangium sp. GDMCC 1.1324]